MVSTVVLSGIFGIAGSVLGYSVAAWSNLKSTEKQIQSQQTQLETQLEAQREQLETEIKSEHERRRAEYYLDKKVEALIDVHSTLEEARRLYKRRADMAGHSGISEEEYQEVIDQYDEYERMLDRASIFLEDDQHETLIEVLNVLHRHHAYLHSGTESEDGADYSAFDLREFNEKFDTAEEMLREEVKNPIEAITTE